MKITLKINEFLGQDDQGRYKLQVNAEDIAAIIGEHPDTFLPYVFQENFLEKHPKEVSKALANNAIRNHIFQYEKQRRVALKCEEVAKSIHKEAKELAEQSMKKILET